MMDECVGFETQFTSVMQNVLRTAVGEATKLFEQTLHQLNAELVHLRQENVGLKSGILPLQHNTKEAADGCPRADHAKRDIGVQCEKPTMVERCCSPAPIGDRLTLRHITSERLQDLCSSSTEEGNRQLALLLIKKEPQETDEYAPGYFLLKQEGSEPILVRKEPFKNTMEKVLIPSTIQTVSRGYGTQKEKSATIESSPDVTVSCNYRMELSCNSVNQTERLPRVRLSSPLQSDRERQNKSTLTKNSTLTGPLANSTQPLPPASVSASTALSSRLGHMSIPRTQQAVPSVQTEESLQATIEHSLPSSQQFVQNIQHSGTVSQFVPKLVTSPLPQNQNPITESCPASQILQTMGTITDKRFSVSKSVTSLTESLTQATKPSISHPQTIVTPTQNMTQLCHFPPRVQAPFPQVQHPVAQGHVPTSVSQIQHPPNQVPIPPPQVPVQQAHLSITATHAPSQVHVQANDMLPPNSQSLHLQGHLPSVPHHDLTPSTQPFYPLNHASFAPPYIPLQSLKPSVPPSSISQTGVSSPLEHATSHYDILSDPLCSSSDQFFPTPDNTSDLLQPMPPMSFHSPVVLNQQETTSMIHSSSGQPLQLAPLLTLKEQQAAASNHGNLCKRGPNMSVEIPMSTVNSFEEHMQRYPPLASHDSSDCESESITVEMHNEDSTENNENSRSVVPGPIQHYTVLSKPGPNFIVPDSTKEQQTFRMNMVKDLQMDNDMNRQKEGCDTTCQVWEPSDLSSLLSQSALGASAHTMLQKPLRKVLEKKTECSECGRILSNASSLENHMRLHRGERPYTCSQCGKAFPSVRGLNRHVKVHAEEKGYKCEECGRSFVYQFTLTKHKLIHSGDRPFPCKICGKKFLAKADRATHMRMHTGEKPFFCNQCGKTFKHRVALNMHMQGHRGEKRYVCPHCEKGFVDLGNFKRHKRIHTGEKPFECKECGKRFTQSAHLKKHINTQHAVVKPK